MEVKLNPLNPEGTRPADLRPDRVYRVLGIEADDYRIVNEAGRPFLYPPEWFHVVDSHEPEEWVATLGDEGERYAYPPELGRPGFFEDYFDDKPQAVEAFARYMARPGE